MSYLFLKNHCTRYSSIFTTNPLGKITGSLFRATFREKSNLCLMQNILCKVLKITNDVWYTRSTFLYGISNCDPEPVNNSQDECKIHNRNIKGKFF